MDVAPWIFKGLDDKTERTAGSQMIPPTLLQT
jgi:hypothetical protein